MCRGAGMKATLLPRSPVDLLFVAFLLWLGSAVDQYLLSIGWGKPLYAYILLLVVAIGYLFVQGGVTGGYMFLNNHPTRRYVLWLLLYGAYGAFAFLESSQSEVAVQSLIYLCEAIVLGFGFTVLMLHSRRYRQATVAFALLAVFASAMNVFDFLHPTFSDVPGRAAGLYGNANISGAFVPLVMLCGVTVVPRALRWPFLLACGIGTVVTFSREGWLMWGIGVAWLGWHLGGNSRKRRVIAVTFSVIVGLWFLAAVFLGRIGDWLSGTHILQYLDPNTLARLGVGGLSFSDFAAQQRLDAALYAWHQFQLAPLFGHGIGYVFEWGYPKGPHNMFLRFMAEGGLVGLGLYLGLFWILWRASAGTTRVVVLGFFIASLFSHNVMDQPEFILVCTFVMVDAALRRREPVRQVDGIDAAILA